MDEPKAPDPNKKPDGTFAKGHKLGNRWAKGNPGKPPGFRLPKLPREVRALILADHVEMYYGLSPYKHHAACQCGIVRGAGFMTWGQALAHKNYIEAVQKGSHNHARLIMEYTAGRVPLAPTSEMDAGVDEHAPESQTEVAVHVIPSRALSEEELRAFGGGVLRGEEDE